MDNDYAIILENVSKKYRLYRNKKDRMKEALHPMKKKYHTDFFAVNDISLNVKKGEILGILGMNGSGKSTALKMIADVIKPTSGRITSKGKIVPLLELGGGFNPEYSGMDNIYFYCSIIGISRKETERKLQQIIDFAEIGDFIYQPIKTYSSGMRARLGFAVSVNIDPDILILDEILSVGDELFRRKSFSKIEEFFKAGKTILFVSHAINSINQLCTRAIMLHKGKIVLDGPPKFITMNYQKFLFSKPHEKNKLLSFFNSPEIEESIKEFKELPAGGNVDQIHKNKEGSSSQKNETAKQKTSAQPYFIPNFESKTSSIIRNKELYIDDIRIETLAGTKVNSLVVNKQYFIKYNLTVKEDIDQIRFALTITNEKSVVISFSAYPDLDSYKNVNLKKGNKLEIKWKFKCLLNKGNHYLNLTLRGIDKDYPILFKGRDLLVFKVLKDEVNDWGGVFNSHFSFQTKLP